MGIHFSNVYWVRRYIHTVTLMAGNQGVDSWQERRLLAEPVDSEEITPQVSISLVNKNLYYKRTIQTPNLQPVC